MNCAVVGDRVMQFAMPRPSREVVGRCAAASQEVDSLHQQFESVSAAIYRIGDVGVRVSRKLANPDQEKGALSEASGFADVPLPRGDWRTLLAATACLGISARVAAVRWKGGLHRLAPKKAEPLSIHPDSPKSINFVATADNRGHLVDRAFSGFPEAR